MLRHAVWKFTVVSEVLTAVSRRDIGDDTLKRAKNACKYTFLESDQPVVYFLPTDGLLNGANSNYRLHSEMNSWEGSRN
jgi:hypothetical protein